MQKNYRFGSNETIVMSCRWVSEDGTPYDISAATLALSPTREDSSDSYAVSLAGANDQGVIVKEAVTFWLGARMEPVPAGLYYYDFNVTRAADGLRKNLLQGEVEVYQAVVSNV